MQDSPESPARMSILGAVLLGVGVTVGCVALPPHHIWLVFGGILGGLIAGYRARASTAQALAIGALIGATVVALVFVVFGVVLAGQGSPMQISPATPWYFWLAPLLLWLWFGLMAGVGALIGSDIASKGD
jgi:thiol:disulfide interchange protein